MRVSLLKLTNKIVNLGLIIWIQEGNKELKSKTKILQMSIKLQSTIQEKMRKDMKEDVNEVSKYYTGENEKINERTERKTRSRMCNGIREGGSKLQN